MSRLVKKVTMDSAGTIRESQQIHSLFSLGIWR